MIWWLEYDSIIVWELQWIRNPSWWWMDTKPYLSNPDVKLPNFHMCYHNMSYIPQLSVMHWFSVGRWVYRVSYVCSGDGYETLACDGWIRNPIFPTRMWNSICWCFQASFHSETSKTFPKSCHLCDVRRKCSSFLFLTCIMVVQHYNNNIHYVLQMSRISVFELWMAF